MLMDKENLVSDAQNLAVAAGAVLSDYSIDLGASATDNLGNTPISDIGRDIEGHFLVQVTETFASGGAATLTVELVMADNAALTSNLTVLQSSGALALATLVAGYHARVALPPGVTKRYLGCRYTIATAAMTAGKVTAGFVRDRQTNVGTM